MKKTLKVVLASILLSSFVANAEDSISKDKIYSEKSIVIEQQIDSPFVIDSYSNLIYNTYKDPSGFHDLKMHVFAPRTNSKNPAIIYFPGGGFFSANHDKYLSMRYELAKAGFVVASAEYSVVPTKFPQNIYDGKAAIRYLKAHAEEFNIDPNRIGVLGDSAGGYMSQFMGVSNGQKQFDKGDNLDFSSDVQAAVSIYGISNLLNIGEGLPENLQKPHESPAVTEALLVHGTAFFDFPGATIGSDKDKALEASPISYVDKNDPAIMLMHGSKDLLVSPNQSKQMFDKLTENGVDATHVVLKDAGHGDFPWYQNNIIKIVKDFFVEKLGGVNTEANKDSIDL